MIRRHRTDLIWLGVAVGTVWLVWLYPLLLDPRHYFQGDTQNAYYGWFHHLGDALLHGRWPMLDVQTASAGNPLAEGQEGLYNPLSWLIGIGAVVAPQLVVYATLVKLAIAALAVVGCYLLAREYAVRPGLAAVAAVAVQLGGFTLSADAPRWIAGQLVAALVPWAWWAARRTVAGASPWPLLVATYLLVTTGYVFGTIYLGLALVGLLLEVLLGRDRAGVRRLLLLGGYVALLCVAVYLPGILSSSVTWRDGWEVEGPGFLEMEPATAPLGVQPTAVSPTVRLLDEPSVGAAQVTFTYVAWFLPLVCWVVYARLRHDWRSLLSLVVPLALAIAWTLLPYYVGPLRMPGRVMAMVTLTAVLLVVVLVDRALDASAAGRPSRRRLALSLVWVTAAAVGAVLLRPSSGWLQLGAGGAVAVCVVAAFLATPGRRRLLPAVMIAASAAIALLQLTAQPDGIGGERGSPGELAAYDDLLPGAEGDVLVVGLSTEVLEEHPGLGRTVLPGSLWDLTGKPVHNGYTPLGFRAYNDRFCIRFNGDVCPEALTTLFETEPTTGLPWVDLHAITTLVLVDLPAYRTAIPPPGWHMARDDDPVVTWVRDRPLPTAGGVVWTSTGTRVTEVSRSETAATFRVDAVGTDPSVVLSRIAWPGYRVDGGTLDDPLGGHLLRVRLSPDDVGATVTVTFRPPGWRLEVASLAAALALGVGWTVVVARRRRAEVRSSRTSRRDLTRA